MSKTKDIEVWMPLFIGDYLSDTARLTTEQHGAYLLIIMDYWKNGAPPDDDNVLSSIAKLTVQAWRKHRASIAKLFQIEGGEWKHKRIERELENAVQRSKVTKERAKKAAQARWDRQNSTNQAHLDECSKHTTSTNQAHLEDMLGDAPSPSPSPIIKIHTQNAREDFSPNLEKLNDMLKRSGSKPIEQTQLEQALVTFNPHYEHHELTENQRYAKLVTWLKRDELKQNKPNARASPTKQRLDFDSVLEKQNQMRDVTPIGAMYRE